MKKFFTADKINKNYFKFKIPIFTFFYFIQVLKQLPQTISKVKFNFKLRTFSPKIKLKCLWSSINKHFLNSIFRWTFAIHMQQVQERLLWNLGTLSVSEMSWFLFLCQVLLIYWAFSWDESTWRFFFRLRFKI